MNSIKATAQRAGALYFVFMMVAIFREFLFPSFMVSGDAAATARNITAGELTYRIGILVSFSTLIMFIFLVAILYKLFRDVDKSHARFMVLLVLIGVAIALANLLSQFAPLVLLSGADYLSAYTKPQLDALVLASLKLHSSGAALATAFWGLWLIPFGILVIKSGFLPRILGILLLVAGFAYLTSSVTSMVYPAHVRLISKILMPLYFGEVPIIFWLLIKGARVAAPAARPPQAG